jgi:hypothetical protein
MVFAPTRACAREGQPASSASRSSRQHGLSDTDIRKRAKANGWTRDLSGAGAPRAAAASTMAASEGREPAELRRLQGALKRAAGFFDLRPEGLDLDPKTSLPKKY